METIIAFDSHKYYTLASVETAQGKKLGESRIRHRPGEIKRFLSGWKKGTPVAVETIGNWYWIVDEIEEAGMVPRLVHARKAKLMLGSINKTDKLDTRGLNKLQRAGTLPTVWIPPGELRDHRELPRTRMVFGASRTRLKNRCHSVLAKYGLQDFTEMSDIFGKQGRQDLRRVMGQLPSQTRFSLRGLLQQLDAVERQMARMEKRMRQVFEETCENKLLQTLPGVGFILAVVIAQEIGDVKRFGASDRLASYAGTTPRVHASGGKVRYGRLRPDVNRYLKWAFLEAANVVVLNHRVWGHRRHVSRLYLRIKSRRGYPSAVGAVGRHLAEATYWMLRRQEVYKEREKPLVSSTSV